MTDTEKEDALQVVRIAAAHHVELVEMATTEPDFDFVDLMADAGDCLDVAIVIAHDYGATLFELWRASRLPTSYIARLTEGLL